MEKLSTSKRRCNNVKMTSCALTGFTWNQTCIKIISCCLGNKKGKCYSKCQKQEEQLTKTLMAITVFFLVLLIWQCVTQCFWMQGYGLPHSPAKWSRVQDAFSMAKLGVVINAATNWIFFCGTCSVFRKELRKLFRLPKWRNGSGGSEDDYQGRNLKSSSAFSPSVLTIQSSSNMAESNFWWFSILMCCKKMHLLWWWSSDSWYPRFIFSFSFSVCNKLIYPFMIHCYNNHNNKYKKDLCFCCLNVRKDVLIGRYLTSVCLFRTIVNLASWIWAMRIWSLY